MSVARKKKTPAALIAGIIISVVGVWLIGMLARDIHGGVISKTWPSVSGSVQSSQVHQVTKKIKHHRYKADIRYTYEVEGKSYSSSRIDFSTSREYLSHSEAQAIVAKYPRGSEVRVLYKQDDPEEAVLESVIKLNVSTLLFSPFILLLGLYLLRSGFKQFPGVSQSKQYSTERNLLIPIG
jgi:hypothetical protein